RGLKNREKWSVPQREANGGAQAQQIVGATVVVPFSIALSLIRLTVFVIFWFKISHWNVHKDECGRLKRQMGCVQLLNDFPFTFSREATYEVCEKMETRCSFLDKLGIHRAGIWICECSCGSSVFSLDHLRSDKGWSLSSRLFPCKGIVLVSQLMYFSS
ncbi:hypothetical protein M8C21_019186, partial [Ambrosia artemisiifolia]